MMTTESQLTEAKIPWQINFPRQNQKIIQDRKKRQMKIQQEAALAKTKINSVDSLMKSDAQPHVVSSPLTTGVESYVAPSPQWKEAGTMISTGLSLMSMTVGTGADFATQIQVDKVGSMSHVAPLSFVKEVGTVPYIAPSPLIEDVGTMALVAPSPLHEAVYEYIYKQSEDKVNIGDEADDEHSEDLKEDNTCSHLFTAFNGHPDTATVIDT
ncbi:hypothetical protein A4A49_12920 [Nicotiana attenuata]|uniref:Uncharacterized protein n=1 Tax=Nicotiana attenuata TaxID=49451 RepID=A0A314KQE1_NICAT|nr:hypothetical protein A4A49_12920 [Nicotiana attenuata]